jgi:SAM-dependent methyltransferase
MLPAGGRRMLERAGPVRPGAERPELMRTTNRSHAMNGATIKDHVRERYGQVARGTLSSRDEAVRSVAEAFGYSREELAAIPAEANMGLSCGNPTALAGLRAGETVVDLGSGGGLDVFLASGRVGPTGRVIGIDLSPDMVARARRGARTGGYTNVEFHQAEIESLPLATGSADCVISNCVLNLVPDKRRAFAEIARVLKPGGRLAASDIALKRPLPPALATSVAAYTGCIAGAIPIEQYRAMLLDAGFEAVEIIDANADLNAYSRVEGQSCCHPPAASPGTLPIVEASGGCCGGSTPTPRQDLHDELAATLRTINVNDYAASVKVYAVKPRHT